MQTSLYKLGLALGFTTFGVFARPTGEESVVLEHAPTLPEGWNYLAPAAKTDIVKLSVAVKQASLDELRKRLDVISNPSHAEYGNYLGIDDLRQYQQPDDSALDSVLGWLKNSGIENAQKDGAWVRFSTSIEQAESLLECEFKKYQNADSAEAMRASQYSIPSALVQYIDFVYPVTQFISAPKRREVREPISARQEAPPASGSCGGQGVVPDCVAEVYNINYIPPDNASGSKIGIAGFLEEYPNAAAVQAFLGKRSPRRNSTGYSPNYNFTIESVNGGVVDYSGSGVEAILDTEYIMPFTQPLDVTYFSTGGRGPEIDLNGNQLPANESGNEPWVEFVEYLIAKKDVPQVISISYTDDEQAIPLPYAQRVCDLFMQLTARGVSVLVASGDGGAAGIRYGDCQSNDGKKTNKFIPTFPVDCPYVTGVGATAAYFPQGAASFSSGGFSEYFPRPAWQEEAASAYIKAINGSHNGWYKPSGRAIPDISAMGSRYLIGDAKFEWTQSGTSASTPVVASIFALINDQRLRAGKPVLGFLNPLLYSPNVSAAFFDIQRGSAGSCTYGNSFEPGWDAIAGYDPVTGIGAPDFKRLSEVLLNV